MFWKVRATLATEAFVVRQPFQQMQAARFRLHRGTAHAGQVMVFRIRGRAALCEGEAAMVGL